MKFTISELLSVAEDYAKTDIIESNQKFSISTDTRTIKPGDIYLPLKGESFDGEKFIEDAIKKGAVGYFTTTSKGYSGAFEILVRDTKIAYLQLANFYKKKIAPFTIAITGSSGKTTTKEILASIFEVNRKTHKSKLNHNNEIGLCQTLLDLSENIEVLIVEMGMRGLGEIELLSKYAQPDYAIITNIGSAHIGRLGSRENIAKAKCEVVKYLASDGQLITHEDSLYAEALKNFNGVHNVISRDESNFKIISMSSVFTEFMYKNEKYNLNVGGEYNVLDALLGIEAALQYGLTPDEIRRGLDNYKTMEKRFEEVIVNNLTIINDSYNANPDSMKAALKSFIELYDGEKVLVLADMKELGENEIKYHKEIGEFLNHFENLIVYTVGDLAKNISENTKHKNMHFCDNIEVANAIKKIENETKIFLKGSNSMNLYKIIEEIKK